MPRTPYRLARQEHLGDMLDQLKNLGLIIWDWGYEVRQGRKTGSAIYWVTESGRRRRKLDTKRAEDLALKLYRQQGIVWLPVPHPGGEPLRAETLRKINELKRGIRSAETSNATHVRPIKPVPCHATSPPTHDFSSAFRTNPVATGSLRRSVPPAIASKSI